MIRYTAVIQKPCNVLAEFARKKWENATPDLNPEYFMTARIVVTGDSVYMYKPKHQVGVLNARTSGGKWNKIQGAVIDGFGGVDAWLKHINAIKSDFKGGPKL